MVFGNFLILCWLHFRLLQVQLNSLKEKQKYNILKLVSLYTGSIKINSKNIEHIFTIDDLIEKTKNQHQSQWTIAFGK